MKIYLTIIIACILSTSLSSQEYFNRHFKIEESTITPINCITHNNKLISTFLVFDDNLMLQSGVASYNFISNELTVFYLPGLRIGIDGIVQKNEVLFLSGKQESIDKNLALVKIDPMTMQIQNQLNYESFLDYNFPFHGDESSEFMLRGYSENSSNVNHREFGILKLDYEGNLLWQRNYNQHITRSQLDGIKLLPNGNIVVASQIWRLGEFKNLPQILMLDKDGVVIDSIEGDREVFDPNTDVPILVLNENRIVQAYKTEGPLKDWIRLDFYDADLNLHSHKNIDTWQQEDIGPYLLKEGKGDYFFIVGAYSNLLERRSYGNIMKIDYGGNIIWQHRYLHSDYVDDEHAYAVKDIVEEDNGDIYCMGSIRPVGGLQELWLFKINEQGCLGDDICDEVVITDVEETRIEGVKIVLSPNPASDILNIQSSETIVEYTIYDVSGQIIEAMKNEIFTNEIDLTKYKPGIYLLKLRYQNDQQSTHKFIRL